MSASTEGIQNNASRLLWAGFMAILAAGVGFALRNGILGAWAAEFHFNESQLGAIGGAGFSGFCFGIIIGGVIVDKLGYGKLVALALIGHIISAIVTFGANTPENAYDYLKWGMFIFAYANGTLEAVANPLVATLYPKKRTHYLNILHASWPLGMILGAVASYILGTQLGFSWKVQLGFYLVPTVIYALMFVGQSFPKSEAAQKGSSFAEMFKSVGILGSTIACVLLALFMGDFLKPWLADNAAVVGYVLGGLLLITVAVITKFSIGSFVLFTLFIAHLLIGSVELGTDSWTERITGNLFSETEGKVLFVWTSLIMFALRFCAHWIETKLKLSPIGLLLVCSILAVVGLQLASGMQTFTMALIALGIYAVGKTFFWPTMLAVVGDRFPRSGAVAMSIMGGVGMLSVGLLGGPGLGFSKDYYTAKELEATNPKAYSEVKSSTDSSFYGFKTTPVDGGKLEEAKKAVKAGTATETQQAVVLANQKGDRQTLRIDSFIPAAMALIYLLLFLYFKAIGGYRPLTIEEEKA